MLTFPHTVRIYLAAEPVDLRKGFDALAAATREIIHENPLSGHLFVFINRRANRLKILIWQPSGYVLLYKRLERSCFKLPRHPAVGSRHVEIESAELMLLLDGIDLRGSQHRARWSPKKSLAWNGTK